MENQIPVEPQLVKCLKNRIIGSLTNHSLPISMLMEYFVFPVPWYSPVNTLNMPIRGMESET